LVKPSNGVAVVAAAASAVANATISFWSLIVNVVIIVLPWSALWRSWTWITLLGWKRKAISTEIDDG
jgi:hypothetical protein